MPVREKVEQITIGEDVQFFFQQVGPLRAYTFQVLDG
jgi:hypothetical protein